MNKLLKYFVGSLVLILLGSSCDSMLDVDSNSVAFPDENQLNASKDQIYSVVGILSQLDKLTTPYVLLGELRGDLMSITENADADLKEIYNQTISEDNIYNVKSDYYSVINNCNYFIANADTSIRDGVDKVLLQEYAAIKAFRAWTYMQLVQNYGSVTYIDEPLMMINDIEGDFPEYAREELAAVLIEDLLPYMGMEKPDAISLGDDISTFRSYFPIQFLLGDLYLWTKQYEAAAMMYYDYIENEDLYVRLRMKKSVENNEFEDESYTVNWLSNFDITTTLGKVALIAGSTEYGEGSPLDSLAFGKYQICPSEVAKSNWENQVYYHNENLSTSEGDDRTDPDLRGLMSSYYTKFSFYSGDDPYGQLPSSSGTNRGVIRKYMDMNTSTTRVVNIVRNSTVYLRYAEAVNRAGKPNLAFAALKYGLNHTSLTVDSIVPRSEKYVTYTDTTHGAFISWVDFSDDDTYGSITGTLSAYNVGVHALGCGNTWFDEDYKIDSLATLQDSITFVENKIIEEYALEMAFEGNRFQDLMRVALRRDNPEEYLADKVAAKYDNAPEIKAKMMMPGSWYLP